VLLRRYLPRHIKEQLDTLKDKKKMAKMGFEEGIGFIPFAGMGYEAFKTVKKNDSSPVRAAAAKQLAHDPDPGTSKSFSGPPKLPESFSLTLWRATI
jgi:hypothetical protein